MQLSILLVAGLRLQSRQGITAAFEKLGGKAGKLLGY